jgi:hypothetical protein
VRRVTRFFCSKASQTDDPCQLQSVPRVRDCMAVGSRAGRLRYRPRMDSEKVGSKMGRPVRHQSDPCAVARVPRSQAGATEGRLRPPKAELAPTCMRVRAAFHGRLPVLHSEAQFGARLQHPRLGEAQVVGPFRFFDGGPGLGSHSRWRPRPSRRTGSGHAGPEFSRSHARPSWGGFIPVVSGVH